MTKVEVSVMGPQAQECWEPPEGGRDKEWVFLRSHQRKEMWLYWISDF
jgi:hypothetical protein